MTSSFNRRDFLHSAGLIGLATGFSSVAHAAPAAELPKWDESVDILVVGSGFAGLAAAYEAKKAGADVLVLEKMQTPGGNSVICGGDMCAVGTPQ